MPATNISQIRAASDAADTALAAQIEAYGVSAYQARDAEDQPDVFCVCTVSRGPGRHLYRTPIGTLEFDLWEGSTIVVELFCPRLNPGTPDNILGIYDKLGGLAVRVDHALAPSRLDQLNGRLPYHRLTRLYPAGESRGFDEERRIDRHELRYTATLGIRPDAWPTDPSAYDLG